MTRLPCLVGVQQHASVARILSSATTFSMSYPGFRKSKLARVLGIVAHNTSSVAESVNLAEVSTTSQ